LIEQRREVLVSEREEMSRTTTNKHHMMDDVSISQSQVSTNDDDDNSQRRGGNSIGDGGSSDKFPDVITTVGDEIGKKESMAVLRARVILIKVYVRTMRDDALSGIKTPFSDSAMIPFPVFSFWHRLLVSALALAIGTFTHIANEEEADFQHAFEDQSSRIMSAM
jgi:hypothetical protein